MVDIEQLCPTHRRRPGQKRATTPTPGSGCDSRISDIRSRHAVWATLDERLRASTGHRGGTEDLRLAGRAKIRDRFVPDDTRNASATLPPCRSRRVRGYGMIVP